MSVATKKDFRWPTHLMPFRYASNVTEIMKVEIQEAMKHWEENTQVRFVSRKSTHKAFITFNRNDQIPGCGNSGIGYTGGEITINLKESCDVKTVIHEIAHALGIHHEQMRPDRNEFVRINWDNIPDAREHNFSRLESSDCVVFGNYDFESIMHYSRTAFSSNGEDTIVPIDSFNRISPSNRLTNGDIRLARRILPSNVHTHRVGSQGTIGAEIDRYNWTDGWTNARFYTVNNNKFLFLLKKSDGVVHIHTVNNNEKIGSRIQTSDWTSGWSTTEFYVINGSTYLFLLKEGDGAVHIHKMKSDGTVGTRVATDDWTSGWTSAKFYTIGTATYLFLLKENDGKVHIHKMLSNGKVGPKVKEYDWSSGWSNVAFYEVNGSVFLFLLKADSGTIHIHKMKANGEVGQRIATENESAGWTTSTLYKIGNTTYLFLLMESTGQVHIHRMNDNGTKGPRVAREDWSRGWTSAEVTGNFLLLIKANGPAYLI